VAVEIRAATGVLNQTDVRQRLEQVAGVGHVVLKDTRDNRVTFEVEGLPGRSIRADLARTIVGAGWDLNELRTVGMSLEDIFLELTAAEKRSARSTDTNETQEIKQ
jgi:ABC-2 type transport system ATP-binding protein